MAGTKKGARKFAARMKAQDPDYFKKLARERQRKKPHYGKTAAGSFQKGNSFAARGGKAGKRGPATRIVRDDQQFEAGRFEYEEPIE